MTEEQKREAVKRLSMSAESMRAILAGRKSLTTRVVTPQPTYCAPASQWPWRWSGLPESENGFEFFTDGELRAHLIQHAPYHAGERVALSEDFYVLDWSIPLSELQPLHYAADVPDRRQVEDYRYVAARFMPVWASRQIVVITSVAAGRLHDMTDEDYRREGAETLSWFAGDLRAAYMEWWDRLNGKRYPSSMNPWTYHYGLRRESQ
jgi:hypothetical protein